MRRMNILLTLALMLPLALPVPAQDFTGSNRNMDEVRAGEYYRLGREHLDQSAWDEAARAFDEVIHLGAGPAAGAYYWKAYALHKDGHSQDALTTLAEMAETHPDSRWTDDARVLQLEIRQSAGRPVSPESEEDEELKLIALSGLLHMDEERAIPMLEKILRGNSSPQMKEQALFVLVQTGSPRAREILMYIAQGGANPDLQLAALQHIGMFGEEANLPMLREIYTTARDPEVKEAIIMSYGMAGAVPELVAVVETERDADLRREALMHLAQAGAGSELVRLYERQTSLPEREAILEGLAMAGESDMLLQMARKEKDPELLRIAVRSMGMATGHEVRRFLLETYRGGADREVKEAVLDALMMQEAVPEIIEIARTENDTAMKRHAVQMLAMMDSPQATEFLMGILDE